MALLQIVDPEGNSAVPPVSPEQVASLIAATEPSDIRLDELHAGPAQGASQNMDFTIDRGEPSFAHLEDDDVMLVRLEHTLGYFPAGEPDEATKITVAHVLAFQITAPVTVSNAVISAWIETNAYFVAYPYVRQIFTQTTATLGLPPLVLGYMKRDNWPFSNDVEDE